MAVAASRATRAIDCTAKLLPMKVNVFRTADDTTEKHDATCCNSLWRWQVLFAVAVAVAVSVAAAAAASAAVGAAVAAAGVVLGE